MKTGKVDERQFALGFGWGFLPTRAPVYLHNMDTAMERQLDEDRQVNHLPAVVTV